MAGASDLVTAAGYAVAEAAETEHLGPSPFSSQLPAAEPVGLPSRGDLLRILALVVMAGTAIALAIAYFLQELYQYFHFPPIVYYLTLQFLPDWGRGVLFLVLGAIVGAIASRALSGASDRRAGTG